MKRKNSKVLQYPSKSYFTIQDIVNANRDMLTASKSDITIRVRLSNAIESGKVVAIGSIPGGKGAPPKVFALTPITQNVLNKAEQDGINLVDSADKLVVAVSVKTNTPTITPVSNINPVVVNK